MSSLTTFLFIKEKKRHHFYWYAVFQFFNCCKLHTFNFLPIKTYLNIFRVTFLQTASTAFLLGNVRL